MALRSFAGLAVIAVTALGAEAVSAADRAVALSFGTTGFTLEASALLNEKVAVRAGGSLFGANVTREESDLEFDADLKLRSLAGYLDFHPSGGAFRLSGGLVYNKKRVEATAVPTGGTFELDDVTYQASEVGTLSGVGRIGTRTWAPYLGLGFGSPRGDARVFFALDLGVIFQGPPKIELSATGPLASDAGFQADLKAEEDDANDELEPFKYYPVLSIGIGVRF